MDHENQWDDRLRIRTAGRDDKKADQYHHPYEPTPYCVLERLTDSGLIGKDDVVLDYGCGFLPERGLPYPHKHSGMRFGALCGPEAAQTMIRQYKSCFLYVSIRAIK